MKSIVVDASVASKWLLPEQDSDSSFSILSSGFKFVAPDFIYAEISNVLWKRVQRKEISSGESQRLLKTFGNIPFTLISAWPISLVALELANQLKISHYDAMYVALAHRYKIKLITADGPLYDKVFKSPLKKVILWVRDFNA